MTTIHLTRATPAAAAPVPVFRHAAAPDRRRFRRLAVAVALVLAAVAAMLLAT